MIYIRTNNNKEYRCAKYETPRDLIDLINLNVRWINCNGVFINTKNIDSVYSEKTKYRNDI